MTAPSTALERPGPDANRPRTRVWLDVDGVLNLLGDPPATLTDVDPIVRVDSGEPWRPEDLQPGNGVSRREALRRTAERTRRYPVRLDRANVGRLRGLERRNVLVEWATTWNELAPTIFADALGIGHAWPVVHVDLSPGLGKLPSLLGPIERAMSSGERVLWIDDDPGRPGPRQQMRSHPITAPAIAADHLVLLRPRPNRGLADVWDTVTSTLDRWAGA